jgi:hypothetical protein
MFKQLKPGSLEQRLYVEYHRDGILDLVVGIMVLFYGAIFFFGQEGLIGVIAIIVMLYIPLKKRISFPRQGYIRFESEKEQKRKFSLSLVLGLTTFIGFVAFYAYKGKFPADLSLLLRENILLLFGAVMGLILAAVAFFLNNARFYLYAMLAVVLIASAQYFSYDLDLGLLILGFVITAVGISTLLRFLTTYPLPEDASDGEK